MKKSLLYAITTMLLCMFIVGCSNTPKEVKEYKEWYEALQISDHEELKYNVCHYYFNRTTQEMTNMTADENTIFEAPGYMATNLRSDSSHIRYSTVYDNSSRIKVFQNALVPIAK